MREVIVGGSMREVVVRGSVREVVEGEVVVRVR